MTNRSKQKGTAWETAIVNELTRLGFDAKRVVLHGREDQGDIHITGLPIIIEAKNEKTYKLAQWITEANREADNVAADPNFSIETDGVVWAHRQGKANPLHGYVIMDGLTFVHLLNAILEK